MTRKNVKRAAVFMLVGALAAASMGCGAKADVPKEANESLKENTELQENTEEKEERGEKEITALVADSLNPELADAIASTADFRLYEMVYEPLVRYGKNGEIEPGLAERWEISEDGTTYTFYLRKGVKFSDGTDFNADSVLWNAQRWQKNELKGFSAPLKEARKIDDHTVELVFESAAYACLTELTYPRPYRMLGESSLDEEGDFKTMVGTGAWMVENYQAEQEAVMIPNPYYWGEKPKVDKIFLKQVGDGQSRCMALQSGEADISISDIPSESLPVIEEDDSLKVLNVDGTLGFFLIENYENEILQDKNVRQALNYAVNKEVLVNDLLDGTARAATGLLTPETPYVSEEKIKGYSYDLEKAKNLLSESGYEDTDGDGILEKDGETLSLRLAFQTEEYASWKTVCEFLQSEYAKAGIQIELELLESAAYYDAIWDNRDYDLIIYRTYEDSWNPHGFMKGMFCKPEGGMAPCWYDKELDEKILEVLKTVDEEERQQKWDDIFQCVEQNAYTVPLYYPNINYIYNTRLENVHVASTSYEAIQWQVLDKVFE